jgi:hypothetical protein
VASSLLRVRIRRSAPAILDPVSSTQHLNPLTSPRDGRTPPPWAVRAAHLTALTTLPSCLWRLGLAAGFDLGYDPTWMAANASSFADRSYLVTLSLLTEALALLTLGLVTPWGEVLPSWLPFAGARRVPPNAAIVPAALGAVGLILLWSLNPLMFTDLFYDPLEPQGGWQVLMAAAYLPLVLWGPLLAAVTWAYHRRRCTDSEVVA